MLTIQERGGPLLGGCPQVGKKVGAFRDVLGLVANSLFTKYQLLYSYNYGIIYIHICLFLRAVNIQDASLVNGVTLLIIYIEVIFYHPYADGGDICWSCTLFPIPL